MTLVTRGLGLSGTGTGSGTVLVEGLAVEVVSQSLLEIAVTFDDLAISVEVQEED